MQRIKNWFRKGGYALTRNELETINDHPKVSIDPEELERIERNFDHYKGKYPMIEYVNSDGHTRKRRYMTLNMSKQSAELLVGLVFNEQCEIAVSDGTDEDTQNKFKAADDFIQHVFEHNDFKKNLMRYLEPMFATGGLTVRPYVNDETGEIEFAWA